MSHLLKLRLLKFCFRRKTKHESLMTMRIFLPSFAIFLLITLIIAIGYQTPNSSQLHQKSSIKRKKQTKSQPTLDIFRFKQNSPSPPSHLIPDTDLNSAEKTPDLRIPMPAIYYGKINMAKRIVYVIDNADDIRHKNLHIDQHIIKSIAKLKPGHKFTIIFYNDRKNIMANGEKLLMATPNNADFIKTWIKDRHIPIPKKLNSSPIDALRLAFKMKPDHIFLLSTNLSHREDGVENEKAIISLLKELNPKKTTSISVIQYPAVNPKTPNNDSLIMIQIAERYRGNYTYVKLKS